MDEKLTTEERDVIKRIQTAGRWDELWWELALMVPCFFLILAGMKTQDSLWTWIGLAVYGFFRIRVIVLQSRGMGLSGKGSS